MSTLVCLKCLCLEVIRHRSNPAATTRASLGFEGTFVRHVWRRSWCQFFGEHRGKLGATICNGTGALSHGLVQVIAIRSIAAA